MGSFIRPNIAVSRCLGFAATRYNGQSVNNEWVELLKQFVDYSDICPEVEIGLGIPREPLRLVKKENSIIFFQPATGYDYTEQILSYTRKKTDQLKKIDGFILKERSPSCGISGVPIYSESPRAHIIAKTTGFFASGVLDKFQNIAVESDGRLSNLLVREHFYTRIFAHAELKSITTNPTRNKLISFHSAYRLILMGYNQKILRVMGTLVANSKNRPIHEVMNEYEVLMAAAMNKPPNVSSMINVLQHAIGYFKDRLSTEEKKYFLELIESYRKKRITLNVPRTHIQQLSVKFNEEFLLRQKFFNPFPIELTAI